QLRVITIKTEPGIALPAKQRAHFSCHMTMVDGQRTVRRLADGTGVVLPRQQLFVLLQRQAVQSRTPPELLLRTCWPIAGRIIVSDLLFVPCSPRGSVLKAFSPVFGVVRVPIFVPSHRFRAPCIAKVSKASEAATPRRWVD